MNEFLICFCAGQCFLLGFLLLFHPLQQNQKANRWLAGFVLIMGSAFIGVLLKKQLFGLSAYLLEISITALQFLLSPCLFISVLYFIYPAKTFQRKDSLHALPFLVYAGVLFLLKGKDIGTVTLFEFSGISFFVQDLLLVQCLIYCVYGYFLLVRHRLNLKKISSSIQEIDLAWLKEFLLIFLVMLVLWTNDSLFEETYLLRLTPFVYTGAIFFLAYFSVRQKAVFPFQKNDLRNISMLITAADDPDPKTVRLSAERVHTLSIQLEKLMTEDKLFLENDLGLPALADKLGLGLHDTSYLINAATGSNFHQFINRHRVEEAKKLLTSSKLEEFNMLGIAYSAGFNSKTAFNTAFKKWTGQSPTAYAKQHKNTP